MASRARLPDDSPSLRVCVCVRAVLLLRRWRFRLPLSDIFR
jgi:hypothetical protein